MFSNKQLNAFQRRYLSLIYIDVSGIQLTCASTTAPENWWATYFNIQDVG